LKKQTTIKKEARVDGKGLFSGLHADVIFKPAAEDTGIVFVRTDTQVPVKIPALISSLVEKNRRTALGKGDITVETTEHCLAAVRALEIDNIIIEVSGPEMPGLDGSSSQYFHLLREAGVTVLDAERDTFSITEPIGVHEGDASIYALPGSSDYLSITYDLDYTKHGGIGRQMYSFDLNTEVFENELADARTFLLEQEARQFQAMGIGTHLGPEEILVVGDDGPINNSYRYPDECVRHKILDLIGDITLAGMPVTGKIVANKSGHSLNQRLARKLADQIRKQQRIKKTGSDALLDIRRIQRILPHRYPFLLVDKIIEITNENRIVGIKNVTFNELFFQGHFPSSPIMPGVLIVEAMAQVSGLLFSQKLENTGKLAVLFTMDGVKIRRSVVPGDQVVLIAESEKVRPRSAQCRCCAKVDNNVVAEATLKFMLIDDDV
jgi:UDP-3-O-[3-hydroxymyristoyl] N-acetylglucosamine deacetylase/3-hydroxyacyl-[acyl-carrier-protein] dehydratase